MVIKLGHPLFQADAPIVETAKLNPAPLILPSPRSRCSVKRCSVVMAIVVAVLVLTPTARVSHVVLEWNMLIEIHELYNYYSPDMNEMSFVDFLIALIDEVYEINRDIVAYLVL